MYKDLQVVQSTVRHPGHVTMILGDSTEMNRLLDNVKPTSVITSPPYPNRYSYVWNTRPYLYFFDFFSEARQASDLDKVSIGGTWGKATSDIQKGRIEAEDDTIGQIVGPIVDKIRGQKSLRNTNLMANYVMKYFNQLYKHVRSMSKVLSNTAKLAYVVGNSEIKNVKVPTDVFLAEIFGSQNLSVERIVRVRRRYSGKGLYEAIVFASF